MASDAQVESDADGLGITFTAVLPTLTPLTAVGAVGAKAHAALAGISVAEFTDQLGDSLTPANFGGALIDLTCRPARDVEGSFRLTAAGLSKLP